MSSERHEAFGPSAKRRTIIRPSWPFSWKATAVALVLALIAMTLFAGSPTFEAVRDAFDREELRAAVDRAGAWGPVIVVGAMIVAVVASPIPSAPIAMAASAVYGHVTGTALVIVGAEGGALIAFGAARFLGRDAMRRWFGDRLDTGLLGSQNALTMTVLVSRLMPFVSFDLVSYAAGLSVLYFWRFALATLAGIIPASFLLAHFGSTATDANAGPGTWIVLALGLVTGLPLVWGAVRTAGKDRRS